MTQPATGNALADALRAHLLAALADWQPPAFAHLKIDSVGPGPRSTEISLYGTDGGFGFVATVALHIREFGR